LENENLSLKERLLEARANAEKERDVFFKLEKSLKDKLSECERELYDMKQSRVILSEENTKLHNTL
jgi:hypothetical protein